MDDSNKIFRLHKSGSISLKDWDTSSKIKSDAIATIKEPLPKNQAKVATSIPTPFARIHLFDTAFSIIGENHFGDSMYHKMVSDVFDVFQLIFRIGDSNRLNFVEWNKEVRIEELKSSTNNKHVLLGEAFEIFFKSYNNFDKIYLIYYKGVLLGGTSPLTMFYTSPNWEREINNRGWKFEAITDDILFDDIPEPLHKRDPDFQKFIHKFYIAFRSELSVNYAKLAEHIQINAANYSTFLKDKENTDWANYTRDDFVAEYEQVTLNATGGGFVWSGSIPVVKQKEITPLIEKSSEFVIKNTNKHYKNYKDDKGNDVVLPSPLVLVEGNHQLKYIEAIWDAKTEVPDIPYIDLHQRELPASGNKKYPYVTVGDFLEDALVQMPYAINNENFLVGYGGDFHYLLPIRKNYFNFFGVEDLEKNLKIEFIHDKIVVRLDIPIRNNKKITFVKSYDTNNNEEVVSGKFGLGIFPFYKVVDTPEINKYSLMQIEDSMSENEAKLNLYRMENIVSGKMVNTRSETRVSKEEGSVLGAYSIYYQTEDNDNSFDIIEVTFLNIDGVSGLIIPKFPEIKVNETKLDDFKFAVDFGTSNTHVAYSSEKNPKVRSFDISENDLQVALLNKRDKSALTSSKSYDEGFGELLEISTLRKMEFMPSIIGAGKEPDIQYPARTVVCHGKGVDRNSKVFGNINIAYNVDDVIVRKPNGYYSNIKWGFEDNKGDDIARNRVNAYIEQTLWMIKNKIILNDGNLQPKISYFLPLSMKKSTKEQFHDIWEETYKKVFGNKLINDLTYVTESVVPYFELKQHEKLPFTEQDILNIDIGGGTSDILFFVNTEKKYYSSSFRFAANDIWGDGMPGQTSKNNGFLLMMQSYIKNGSKKVPDYLQEPFANNFENEHYSSADIISFLFKYDNDFRFSDSIKNHKYLKLVLLLHYSATIYHISQLIDYLGINIPMYISFTGKGSEYIKIISKREITDITKLMIEKFTGKKTPAKFEVILINNPKEITAKGGVRRYTDKDADTIKPIQVKHYGFDNTGGLAAGTNENIAENDNNKHYNYGEIKSKNFGESIEKNIFNFLDIFFNDEDINRMIKKDLEINTTKEDFSAHNYLKENISLCFTQLYGLVPKDELNSDIEETLFFWPFRYALFLLSQELFELGNN